MKTKFTKNPLIEKKINIVREKNPEIQGTKKHSKKKDIITTDLNLSAQKDDYDKINENKINEL